MILNSFEFLWLFPIVFVIYYCGLYFFKRKRIPKYSNWLLLIISYALYMQWNIAWALVLLGVTLITYIGAIIIERENAYGKKKFIITTFVILSLIPLLVLKYYDFIMNIFSQLLDIIGYNIKLNGLNWAIPIGLSFFTFQSLGYLWDVYYKRTSAEHNLPDYMLFVAFFPQIMCGPISKSTSLLTQIKEERYFDNNKAVQGLKCLLWGFFIKLVMADRVGLYVDAVYGNYEFYSGFSCFIASIMYSFQIYGDFAGYSLMAIGVAKLLGFELINNFNRPYFSQTITEFWKRWHISLSIWLKDYIYIPIGGSKCSKIRNYLNILITFLVSGIWHGANYTFVLWGILHGVFQIIEKSLNINKLKSNGIIRILRIFTTFLLVNFAWIFFRMPSLSESLDICHKIFTDFNYKIGEITPSSLALLSIFVVFIKELIEEFSPNKIQLFNNKNIVVRWCSYIIILSMIVLLGVLDSGQFIYVSF